MYVCMYIHVCVCMYLCIHIYGNDKRVEVCMIVCVIVLNVASSNRQMLD